MSGPTETANPLGFPPKNRLNVVPSISPVPKSRCDASTCFESRGRWKFEFLTHAKGYPPGNNHISSYHVPSPRWYFWVDDFPNFPRDMLVPWRVTWLNCWGFHFKASMTKAVRVNVTTFVATSKETIKLLQMGRNRDYPSASAKKNRIHDN